MTKVRFDLLEVLAAALDDFDTFQGYKFNLKVWRIKNGCSTICCAMGLAMALPEFRNEGLKQLPMGIAYNEFFGFKAASELLGITEFEAQMLFAPDAYHRHDDPHIVSTRIRQFADSKRTV